MNRHTATAATATALALLAGCSDGGKPPASTTSTLATTSTSSTTSEPPRTTAPDSSRTEGTEAPTSSSTSRTGRTDPTRVTGPAGAPKVPPGKAGTPRGLKIGTVDDANPSSVARAWTLTSWTLDTRLDISPNDGTRRALRWATPDLARTLRADLPGDGGPRWQALKKAKGYTTATTTEINAVDAGKPTGEDASTTQQVKVTYRSSNGRPLGPAETLVLSVRLVKTGAAWRVTSSTLL